MSTSTEGTMTEHEGGPEEMAGDRTRREEHKVSGDKVIERIKQILHEGNVRRIIIRNEDERTLLEIPLSVGVVGALLLPMWAAIGAVAALVTSCSIIVEREDA